MVSPGAIFVARKPELRRAKDPDVRALLKQYLEALHTGTDTLVMEELGLCQGDVRIDVASVNGELSGFEIKSPSDTLARWPKQRRIYSKVVDRAWLVAPGPKLDAARAPDWWGQIAVFDLDDRIGLRIVKPAGHNPKLDPLSIAKLLWRDEAIDLLKKSGRARGVMTKSRRLVWERVVEAITLDQLRDAVRAALRKRRARVAALHQ